MSTLESHMVLHRFMCNQFGAADLRSALAQVNEFPQNSTESRALHFTYDLPKDASHEIQKEEIDHYDENIIVHSQILGMTDEKGKSWKPFQYLALLFTERYLDLYFQDREQLLEKLNQWAEEDSVWHNSYQKNKESVNFDDDDLHTLAFQSATGSGKTLLLHANILQYRHYLKAYKQLHKLNKIILVTPDEGLSRQHLHELRASNISARLFSDEQGTDIFSHDDVLVEVIDLHKLDDKKGVKRVALESFEENNLVMVDEGHLGSGGNVWRNRRKQLAKNGFTFEYSATFNQAVSGGGVEKIKLRDEYGKSILFDYSYKFFYEGGYGKDYKISNLKKSDDAEINNLYLFACLLSFYQQCRIYKDCAGQWRDYNLAPPLWVFLGKTVTGSTSKADKATQSDVTRIVGFLAWTLSHVKQSVEIIKQLTSDNTEVTDANDTDIFRNSFSYIKAKNPKEIYDDICKTVFHAKGTLRISHLTSSDELQLSAGDATPFAVINVGDASGLHNKLQAIQGDQNEESFSISKNVFNKPLFSDVDSHHSPVNIVIGARKFAAGWNSWRVSTMGLMHVGTGEGPQIIQMFGRGVRLKGLGMSLKRHTALGNTIAKPNQSQLLKLLETLNIFGLRANYMDKFKDYLQEEGVNIDRVTVRVKTKKQDGVTDLKIIKKQDDVGEFHYSTEILSLPDTPSTENPIILDRYQHVQTLDSEETSRSTEESSIAPQKFQKRHMDLINKTTVYRKVLQRKYRHRWHNLIISQKTVDQLIEKLENNTWYQLYIPPKKLEMSSYERVREWESLAADLICKYADQYWRKEKNIWEHEHLEITSLDDKNPNYIKEYELKVDAEKPELLHDIKELKVKENEGSYEISPDSEKIDMSLLYPSFHAYIPLLRADANQHVQITPDALNKAEADFVRSLKTLVEDDSVDCLKGKEIHMMRNLSRGHGISFFDEYSFYPDFILWVKDSTRQDILFIDPKGLRFYNHKTQSKVDLHKRIKETEKKIKETHPEIFLHSYIWSHTHPVDIGSDTQMTYDNWHEKGVYFSCFDDVSPESEITNLLKHALEGNS